MLAAATTILSACAAPSQDEADDSAGAISGEDDKDNAAADPLSGHVYSIDGTPFLAQKYAAWSITTNAAIDEVRFWSENGNHYYEMILIRRNEGIEGIIPRTPLDATGHAVDPRTTYNRIWYAGTYSLSRTDLTLHNELSQAWAWNAGDWSPNPPTQPKKEVLTLGFTAEVRVVTEQRQVSCPSTDPARGTPRDAVCYGDVEQTVLNLAPTPGNAVDHLQRLKPERGGPPAFAHHLNP